MIIIDEALIKKFKRIADEAACNAEFERSEDLRSVSFRIEQILRDQYLLRQAHDQRELNERQRGASA